MIRGVRRRLLRGVRGGPYIWAVWAAFGGLGTVAGTVDAQTVDGALDGVETPRLTGDPERDAEIDALAAEIGSGLRCPVCRQQSIAESSARIAREMQALIRGMLVEGRTKEEIEAYFVEAYGPWILLRPRAEGLNVVVYAGPPLAFALGGLVLFLRFRRTRLSRRRLSQEPLEQDHGHQR